uniref:Uncharacterized protein n=1 Tax=Desertifilum tharense IPPAS B-1220 TaxID=1781255 RepID=A0ACD5GUJ7_9CYAN
MGEEGSWGRRELRVGEIKGKVAIALDTLRTQHSLPPISPSPHPLLTQHSALSTQHSLPPISPPPHPPIPPSSSPLNRGGYTVATIPLTLLEACL